MAVQKKAGDLVQFGNLNKMTEYFLRNSLATEHINAHKGKKIIDVGFLGNQVVILFEDMEQMTFEMIGQMGNTTDPSAIVGTTFENININNNYNLYQDVYQARVFISTRFEHKSSLLTVNYNIPLSRTMEGDIFPARIYTTYLNEVQPCHATQETTKKNTKPTMERQPSVQNVQSETKRGGSLPRKAKSTKVTAKMSITSSPYQKAEAQDDPISGLEMLQRIVPIPAMPTLR